MEIGAIGDLRILAPGLDTRDLDPTVAPPAADLIDAYVAGGYWSGLELAGSRINRSLLRGVKLVEADWRNVQLYGCVLERVDLSSAYLRGLTVERCQFVNCRLTGAQLADVTFSDVTFEDCRFDYAVLEEVRTGGPVAWIDCGFGHATMTRCQLATSALSGCRLADLELQDCDLAGTDLRGNDLAGIVGLRSLRGALIDSEQLDDIADLAARELGLDVRAGAEVRWKAAQ